MSATFFCCGSNFKCASKATVSGDSPVFPPGWSITGLAAGKVLALCPSCTQQVNALKKQHENEQDSKRREQAAQKTKWRNRFDAVQSELEQLRREIFG